jgi:hypothetical protein
VTCTETQEHGGKRSGVGDPLLRLSPPLVVGIEPMLGDGAGDDAIEPFAIDGAAVPRSREL